ncbi:hypothetical protein ACTOB_006552 [Actinoplanes oblitus]|uniref:Glutamine amidotransferase type-2 domain-containing protein n=1 Tax=Actinoplanes oblitus TaxID=3040509 RepID=A0ABY8W9P5_9ACTN|nr:hypothetical protein [Actinoplanes oblitus]WIM94525.1 hypothetical protein ACTOB_006552 [Actinoplanes oblitus]
MCRLIVATGDVPVPRIVRAAVAMSTGRTADHDGPITRHPNGWGAVWADPGSPTGLRSHRDVRPMADSWHEAPFAGLRTPVLAIHVRHATLPHNLGEPFTHPLHRPDGPVPWYFMHNGFLPTVYRHLGLAASRFDSAEYFDYLVPAGATELVESEALARLRAIAPGGSSGNAIAMTPTRSYVVHWTAAGNAYPRYFGMHRLRRPGLDVVSSEVIPSLAARHRWQPLPPNVVLDLHGRNRES